MIVTPEDNWSQRKWIRDACDQLIAAMENPDRPCFISAQEWELIRNREPVGGCSDVTEVLQARIADYCRGLAGTVRLIHKSDCGSARQYTGEWPKAKEREPRAENAPGWMVVLTDWRTLSGPGQFFGTYAEAMDCVQKHQGALLWPVTGRITTNECVDWYFTEQPLPHDRADFVLFIPPEGTSRAREAVMRELGEYGGPGEIFTVTITEWFGPQLVWE